ncbi:MAG: hypothetical protein IJO04_05330 [Oscillospiraceae bacterium]|nr:hypothetical protein [Oscillospiraceae bacterium]
MKSHAKKQTYKKVALALSLCALILWGILGTGASLAWFTDTSEEITNIFHFADFELAVSHRLPDGKWEPVDSQTKLFDEEALYEPGYVQVVYLKVENKGDRAFDFHTAVSVNNYTTATNVFGQQFNLHDYLKFGVAIADTEADMDAAAEDRTLAKQIAAMKLSYYATDAAELEPGETSYMALIVRMPEEVGNAANYRGETIPKVELGIIVKADQQK